MMLQAMIFVLVLALAPPAFAHAKRGSSVTSGPALVTMAVISGFTYLLIDAIQSQEPKKALSRTLGRQGRPPLAGKMGRMSLTSLLASDEFHDLRRYRRPRGLRLPGLAPQGTDQPVSSTEAWEGRGGVVFLVGVASVLRSPAVGLVGRPAQIPVPEGLPAVGVHLGS